MMYKLPFYYKKVLRYSVSKTGSFPQSTNTCNVQQVRRRNVTMTSSSLAWRQNWPFENSGTVKVKFRFTRQCQMIKTFCSISHVLVHRYTYFKIFYRAFVTIVDYSTILFRVFFQNTNRLSSCPFVNIEREVCKMKTEKSALIAILLKQPDMSKIENKYHGSGLDCIKIVEFEDILNLKLVEIYSNWGEQENALYKFSSTHLRFSSTWGRVFIDIRDPK